MAISNAAAHHRAVVAGYISRGRSPNDPDVVAAKRDLIAEILAEHVAKTIASAPPLTDVQKDRIAALLRAGGGVSC